MGSPMNTFEIRIIIRRAEAIGLIRFPDPNHRKARLRKGAGLCDCGREATVRMHNGHWQCDRCEELNALVVHQETLSHPEYDPDYEVERYERRQWMQMLNGKKNRRKRKVLRT